MTACERTRQADLGDEISTDIPAEVPSDVAADAAADVALNTLVLESLDGAPVSWNAREDRSATVFLFVRTDCPISNRYAPEYSRLHEAFASRGVTFRFVYVDPDESADLVRAHRADYSLPADAWIDRTHSLVSWTGATITPEAAVVDSAGTLRYRGRIDDRYVDFGKARREASTRDVEDVLNILIAGELPTLRTTKSVGCFIEDLAPEPSPDAAGPPTVEEAAG